MNKDVKSRIYELLNYLVLNSKEFSQEYGLSVKGRVTVKMKISVTKNKDIDKELE